jgi:hypothetical protein
VAVILEKCTEVEWPEHEKKTDWKAAINRAAVEAAQEWYMRQGTRSSTMGNRDMYRRIREAEKDEVEKEEEIQRTEGELISEDRCRYKSRVASARYTDMQPALKAEDVAEIALMRMQYSACVRSHQKRTATKMYKACEGYSQSYCMHHDACKGMIYDTTHVLCTCNALTVLRKARDGKIPKAVVEAGSSTQIDRMGEYEQSLMPMGVPVHKELRTHGVFQSYERARSFSGKPERR